MSSESEYQRESPRWLSLCGQTTFRLEVLSQSPATSGSPLGMLALQEFVGRERPQGCALLVQWIHEMAASH